MSPIVAVIAWILLPMAILPVLTAVVLTVKAWGFTSPALNERWLVSLVLAAVGIMAALLAANRLWQWELTGEIIALPLGLVLLAVDLVSGKWLIDYLRGRYR